MESSAAGKSLVPTNRRRYDPTSSALPPRVSTRTGGLYYKSIGNASCGFGLFSGDIHASTSRNRIRALRRSSTASRMAHTRRRYPRPSEIRGRMNGEIAILCHS
ncbi:hypothetical protein RLV_5735 [Rhizobium leguminosarum bv. viciae]|nr:hypothetical protein RLV_5735 [Rhizobium leguminosarum bv. viciae]